MEQNERESVKILLEAADLQRRKSQDYQNPLSRVCQADYYPRGVNTILDTMNGKILRMYSVLETMEAGGKVNFESVEDSAIDLINYASFLVAYMRGQVDGQDHGRDIFNRRVTKQTHPTVDLIPTAFRGVNNQITDAVTAPNTDQYHSVMSIVPAHEGDRVFLRD